MHSIREGRRGSSTAYQTAPKSFCTPRSKAFFFGNQSENCAISLLLWNEDEKKADGSGDSFLGWLSRDSPGPEVGEWAKC